MQQEDVMAERSLWVLLGLVLTFLVVAVNFGNVMVFDPVQQGLPDTEGDRPVEPRAEIVDRTGDVLATSIRRRSVYANPYHITDPLPTARKLAPVIDRSTEELHRRLTGSGQFVWLERKVSEEQESRIRSLDLPGIGLVPEYERVYPQMIDPDHLSGVQGEPWSLASHVLGHVDIDNRGLAGVELQFDDRLRSVNPMEREPGEDPLRLRLTLDKTIQHIVEEELASLAGFEEPNSAMAVVMDPRTAEIRAIANWPSFDGNDLSGSTQSERRNLAVSNSFEPGSTLKTMTLAAGLDEGTIGPNSNYYCGGSMYFPQADHTIEDYTVHEDVTLPDVLIESCNIGTVKAVGTMDRDTFYQRMRQFGFGNRTGVRLPGEARGSLRRPNTWSVLTQPSMAIGQGISVNALQLTNAMVSITNGGELFRPRIAEGMVRGGQLVEAFEPFRIRRVLEEETTTEIRSYLEGVVTDGTGQAAGSDRYRLAGKTGTAQKANLEGGGYAQDEVIASFSGFGPVGNPRLVVSVIVDEPQVNSFGGDVAGPVFKRIMERSLDYLNRQ